MKQTYFVSIIAFFLMLVSCAQKPKEDTLSYELELANKYRAIYSESVIGVGKGGTRKDAKNAAIANLAGQIGETAIEQETMISAGESSSQSQAEESGESATHSISASTENASSAEAKIRTEGIFSGVKIVKEIEKGGILYTVVRLSKADLEKLK